MKIAFVCTHPYWGGMSNNGGSRTILKSAAELRKLGNRVDVVACADKFTWFKHPPILKKIPKDTEACVACSVSDIKPMLKTMPKTAKAFWWARLLEKYAANSDKIVSRAARVRTLVNSEYLQGWFEKRGVSTQIAYQGVDIEDWRDDGMREKKNVIGFLLSKKPRKRFKDIKRIVKILGSQYEYVGYGAKGDLSSKIKHFAHKHFTYFKTNPTHSDLLRLYNLATIWVATSDSEGLHNPPQEAALCGCLLVCNGAQRGGTADYAINEKTAYVYEKNNPAAAANTIVGAVEVGWYGTNEEIIRNCQYLIKTKLGSRFEAMQRLERILHDYKG